MTKSNKPTPSQYWLEHIYDSKLPPPAKAVAAFLASRMYGSKDSCWPSAPTVAEKTGYSERSCRDHINLLIDEKWLRVTGYSRGCRIFTACTPAAPAPPAADAPAAPAPLQEIPLPPAAPAPESVSESVKNIHRFKPPSVDEVKAYCEEKNYGVDPETFVDWNSSKGWMIGKNKMKDWKAAVRTWQRRESQNGHSNGNSGSVRQHGKSTVADRLRADIAALEG